MKPECKAAHAAITVFLTYLGSTVAACCPQSRTLSSFIALTLLVEWLLCYADTTPLKAYMPISELTDCKVGECQSESLFLQDCHVCLKVSRTRKAWKFLVQAVWNQSQMPSYVTGHSCRAMLLSSVRKPSLGMARNFNPGCGRLIPWAPVCRCFVFLRLYYNRK